MTTHMALFHCVVRLGSARLVTAQHGPGWFAFPLQFSTALRPVHTGTNFARDIRRRLTPRD